MKINLLPDFDLDKKLSKNLCFSLVFLLVNFNVWAQTTVTIGGGATITCPATPTATYSTPPTGVTFSNWSRGSGVTCASAGDAISGSGFNTADYSASYSGNKYYSITITADATHTFTLSQIKWLTTLSGTASGTNFTIGYSNNGGAFTTFGTTAQTGTTTNTFNGSVSVAAGKSIVLYFIPANASQSGGTVRFSNNSTITVTASAASTNDTTSIVDGPLLASQPAASSISSLTTTSAAAVKVFDFNVIDAGTADSLPTNVTQITIQPGNNNTANWSSTIGGIRLYDGASEITPTGTTITNTGIVLTFSSPIVVTNNSTKTLSLYTYLKSSGIVDNNILEFNVPTTSHGFVANASGSTFASTFTNATTSNKFTIDVVATNLAFTTQPSSAGCPDTNLASPPAVTATDTNGNKDLDFTSQVTLISNSVTLPMTNYQVNAVNGVATFANLQFTALGTTTLSASATGLTGTTAGNSTVISIPNVTATAATNGNTQSSVSWTNPSSCYDEIMIVAKLGSAATALPSGNGSAYTANLIFTNGTSFDGGYVVYKGASSPQIVTNLTNGSTYYFTYYTRKGNFWSSGVSTSATPSSATASTDYFRSKTTGTWAASASWESSSDNATWISATSAPTSSATKITVQSGHTITSSAAATSQNLAVEAGATLIISANTFNLSGTNVINGTLTRSSTSTFTNSSTSLTFGANSIYNHALNGGAIPTATWNAASTVNITGMTSTQPTASSFGQIFGNFTWNSTGQSTYAIMGANGAFNPKGLFTVTSTGSNVIELESDGTGANYYFDGGVSVTGGIFDANYGSGSSVPETSLIVTGDFSISGGGVVRLMDGNGTTATGYGSTLYLNNDLKITSSASYPLTAKSTELGFVLFQGTEQNFNSTNTTNSRYVDYQIYKDSKLNLTSDIVLFSSSSSIYDLFSVYGTLNFNTYLVKQNSGTQARFTSAADSKLITSNTGGFIGSVTIPGTKTFTAGTNYTWNANTTTPFPVSFGNPASLTFNNAVVTSNKSGLLTVTGTVDINGTSAFTLLGATGNNLSLGGNMTIDTNATFDNNGENQIINGGGSVSINGKFITKDKDGFTGTNTAMPSITPTLGTGSTVEYGLLGDQTVTTFAYNNLTFSGSGTKTTQTISSITGLVTINSGVTLDVGTRTFGGSGTNLTMLGTSLFKTGGSGTKPDATGTYTLAATSTIEFGGTSGTTLRAAPSYGNINIANTTTGSAGLSGDSTTLTLQGGSTFTVKNGAVFNVRNINGLSGASNTAVSNTNSPAVVLETGSTVNYNGTAAQTVTNPIAYYNLNISGSGTKTAATGTLTVNNLTTVSAGTLKMPKTADNMDANVLVSKKGIQNTGGTVTFENNSQLMQDDSGVTNSDNIQFQRDVTDMNNISTQTDYIYWGSPVSGQIIKGATGFSPDTPANGYLQYNESNDKFTVTADNTFQTGKGYAIRAEDVLANGYNKTYSFTGTPNNSNLSFTNLNWTDADHGYNLVGNPYPSNIDFDALYLLNKDNIYCTAWLWTNNSYTATQVGSNYGGNNYAIYNGTGGAPATYNPTNPSGILLPNGIIKMGQGFIVQAKSAGQSQPLSFNNGVRVTGKASFFQRSPEPKNRFWLTMRSPNDLINTILIGYIPGATDGYEIDFDGELFVVGSDSFYSVLGAKKLAIQGKAASFSTDDKITLGNVYYANGSYTIGLQNGEGIFDNSQKIYLRDKLLDKYIDLTTQDYQFSATKGTDNTRFEIVYIDGTTLGAGSNSLRNFLIYKDQDDQVIRSSRKLGRIEMFDATGRLIKVLVVNDTQARLDTTALSNGVYILKIENSGDVRTGKFIK